MVCTGWKRRKQGERESCVSKKGSSRDNQCRFCMEIAESIHRVKKHDADLEAVMKKYLADLKAAIDEILANRHS